MKAFVYFLIALALSLVAGAAFDKDATAANTVWTILALRYFFWAWGCIGAFGFGCASFAKIHEWLEDIL